jgi:hypothetical protein
VVERSDSTGEPSEALVPGAYCPSHPSSRTIYGLIAYLCQIAERISSDPFDPLQSPDIYTLTFVDNRYVPFWPSLCPSLALLCPPLALP